MATGNPEFEHHVKGIRHAFHEIIKPYSGVINVEGTQLGFATFKLGISYNGRMIIREVGPFDMAKDFDHKDTQKKIGKALAEATMDACQEMMDPHGNLQTISVKEVYAEVAYQK